MPDTQRSLSDLLTALFQDGQAVSSITPQDVRDLIVSVGQIPYGGIYSLAPVETIIPSSNTYVKALGTTQNNNLRNFDMPVDNRLRYTGALPYHMHIALTLSMMAAGNNKLAGFKMFKFDDSAGTGALIDGSVVRRFIATGSDEGSTALHWDVVLDNNDYLELHVANLTDATNITVSNMYLFAVGMEI